MKLSVIRFRDSLAQAVREKPFPQFGELDRLRQSLRGVESPPNDQCIVVVLMWTSDPWRQLYAKSRELTPPHNAAATSRRRAHRSPELRMLHSPGARTISSAFVRGKVRRRADTHHGRTTTLRRLFSGPYPSATPTTCSCTARSRTSGRSPPVGRRKWLIPARARPSPPWRRVLRGMPPASRASRLPRPTEASRPAMGQRVLKPRVAWMPSKVLKASMPPGSSASPRQCG